MFERFTDDARQAVVVAQEEARSLRHAHLGTEHLLLGLAGGEASASARILRAFEIDAGRVRASILRLVGDDDGVLGLDAEALGSLGIDLDEVRERIEETFGPGALDQPVRRNRSRRRCGGTLEPYGHLPITPRAKKVLELSLREARHLGHGAIGTEHLLLGLVRVDDGVAARILAEAGATRERVGAAVIEDRSRRMDPPGASA